MIHTHPKPINSKSNTKSNESPSNFIPHGHPCPKMRRQRQKRVVDCQKKSFGKSLEVHRGVAFFLPVSKLPFLSKAEQGSSVRRLLLLLLLRSEAGGLTAHAFSSKATPRHDCTYRCTKGDIYCVWNKTLRPYPKLLASWKQQCGLYSCIGHGRLWNSNY